MTKRMKGYRVLLWKRYFDQGYGLSSYLKYIVAYFGLKLLTPSQTIYLVAGYIIFCFALGYVWLNSGLFETETEITNKFNPFVKEMREKI